MKCAIGRSPEPGLTSYAIPSRPRAGAGLTYSLLLGSVACLVSFAPGLAAAAPLMANEAMLDPMAAPNAEAMPDALGMAGAADVADAADAGDGGQQFDNSILTARGLQPSIGAYFSKAARFSPGQGMIDVTVNGELVGRKTATFSQSGSLCFTTAFMRMVGLVGVDATSAGRDTPCPGADAVSPQTVVTLDPGRGSVEITTPAQTIAPLPALRMEQGGNAAMFNYRASSFASTYAGRATTRFTQVDSQIGFNTDDWIVRSNQTYANQNGNGTLRFVNAYAQKTFIEREQVFQAGLTYTQSPLFGGIPFVGAQVFPETGLFGQSRYPVSGVATTRARVIITQNGVILLATVVPPGPFSLTDYQPGNRTGDFQVQVIEESGAEQRFTVPVAEVLLASGNAIAGGSYLSAGLLSDASAGYGGHSVPLLTAEKGWAVGPSVSLSTGALVAGKYLSVGAAARTALDLQGRVSLYAQALSGHDLADDAQGMLGSTALSWSNASNLQLGVSAVVRTARYRSAQEALLTQRQQVRASGNTVGAMHTQLGANANYTSSYLGNINASVTHQTAFSAPASNTYSLGWGTSVGKGQLSVGIARTIQAAFDSASAGGGVRSGANNGASNSMFLTLYVPLGREATLSSNMRRSGFSGVERSVVDTNLSQRLSDTVSYQAGVQKTLAETGVSKNISVTAVPMYSTVTLGAGSGPGMTSYFAQASGGIVANGQGVSFAPNAIQDTFAVVKVGELAGIRINTPQGPVWSGYGGLAAVPALTPFGSSSVEIVATSLPQGVDVDQSVQVVRAGRGAFVSLDIRAKRVQRVLLTVMYNGAALAERLPVMTGERDLLTTSLAKGRVMLDDYKADEPYSVRLENGATCSLRDIHINDLLAGAGFQRGAAICQ